MQIALEFIGTVRSPRVAAEDDNWGGVISTVELDPARFTPEALRGLNDYSHAEIVFFFDRVPPEKIQYASRHPREREDWPEVGIFAQRGRNRPNRLGTTICRIVRVEGLTLTVEGLDAIEGTPVLYIKPYMEEFGPRGHVRQPAWSRELMREYFAA